MTAPRRAAKEISRQERETRRRTRFATRIAEAESPSQQVGAASDHLRAILACLPHHKAERIARDAISALTRSIEAAYHEEARS